MTVRNIIKFKNTLCYGLIAETINKQKLTIVNDQLAISKPDTLISAKSFN